MLILEDGGEVGDGGAVYFGFGHGLLEGDGEGGSGTVMFV